MIGRPEWVSQEYSGERANTQITTYKAIMLDCISPDLQLGILELHCVVQEYSSGPKVTYFSGTLPPKKESPYWATRVCTCTYMYIAR